MKRTKRMNKSIFRDITELREVQALTPPKYHKLVQLLDIMMIELKTKMRRIEI